MLVAVELLVEVLEEADNPANHNLRAEPKLSIPDTYKLRAYVRHAIHTTLNNHAIEGGVEESDGCFLPHLVINQLEVTNLQVVYPTVGKVLEPAQAAKIGWDNVQVVAPPGTVCGTVDNMDGQLRIVIIPPDSDWDPGMGELQNINVIPEPRRDGEISACEFQLKVNR